MINHEKTDVVIVGSGAAGSVYAAVLAEGNKDVLVLEKGGARELDDLYSSQIWARRLKWGTPHVPEEGKHSIWFNFNAGQGYGGSAIHHFGVWPRYHAEDMRAFSLYGKALDWPYDYDELRPYYDKIQEDVGIAGDAKQEIWRPEGAPYPLPPVLVSNHGKVLAKGFEKLGMHTSPVPMAILTRPYKGRAPCIWDGWCDAGCPIGALANPLVVYLPRAKAAGAQMRPGCHVYRVRTNSKGNRATGVEYFDDAGQAHFQPADTVILAAFTIENSRILLNSTSDKHPDGLSNSNGLVGKYLMSHPSVSVFGMFEEQMQNFLGATGGQLLNQDHFEKTKNGTAFGSRQWILGQALKPNDLLGISMSRPDLYGAKLDEFMRQASQHLGSMVAICEDQPVLENRVELSTEKDKFGVPLAKTIHTVGPDGLELWQQSAQEGLELFKAAGVKSAWHGPQGGQHVMGGTIMGNKPASSVTNGEAQLHEVDNVFIGGPGVFPTSSCVNSTFTAHAVALKSAEYILAN